MSGGPVYDNRGIVLGLVKGGTDAIAVRWITPIQHAKNLIDQAKRFTQICQHVEEQAVKINRAFIVGAKSTVHRTISIKAPDNYIFVPSSVSFEAESGNNAEQVTAELSDDLSCVKIEFVLKGGEVKDVRWLVGTLRVGESKR
jgi:hypothetical protein